MDYGKIPIIHTDWAKEVDYKYRASSKNEFDKMVKKIHFDDSRTRFVEFFKLKTYEKHLDYKPLNDKVLNVINIFIYTKDNMSIINYVLVNEFFTNNFKIKKDTNQKEFKDFSPVKYRWTHGATDFHLGDGLLIYSAIQYMRAKTCVCLGSGGGFIPRIMSQARMDLHDQKIFEGKKLMEWGDVGTTILVDASNGVGGHTDWVEKDSFFRTHFPCRVILDTTENASIIIFS